jgi:type I restriction enzyme S subunit
MIFDLMPYPATKDSGVPWLGEMPAHWEVRRNGRLFAQRNQTGYAHLPILEVSLKTGVRVRDFEVSDRKQVMSDREKYKQASKGDIAYNMMRMWQGAVGVAPVDGLVSPAYVVAKPFRKACARYFELVFRTDLYMNEVNKFSRGIVADRNRLYWEDFKQIPSPFPPPDEQASIVRFLDHFDRRIRRYIRAKQKLIRLLEEQERANVHRLVTRGLNPKVRFKRSGIEILPDVPEHWEVVPLKRRIGFQEGPGIMAADFRSTGVPLLRISCLRGDVATLNGCNYLDPAMVARRWSHFAVRDGDYLLSASASTGVVALATETIAGSIPYTGIIRLWPTSSRTVMPFVKLFLGCRSFQDQINAAKSGVAIEHFGPSHLKRMFISLPPVDEQWAIVKQATVLTLPLASAAESARREIALVREFQTRLVVDVVTGKLDVREAAARLPSETEEAEPLDEAADLMETEDTADDDPDPIPEESEA